MSFNIEKILGKEATYLLDHKCKTVKKEQIFMQPTDTLYVRMQYNNYYSKGLNERERGKYTHDEKNNEIIYSTKVRVHFLPTEQNQPFIQIEKEGRFDPVFIFND